jgi:hypothetical protein
MEEQQAIRGELALLAARGGSGKDAAGVAPEIRTAAATER